MGTFALSLATTSGNLTGDGTTVNVPFDTIDFDQGGNFPGGAGSVFTCKNAGTYEFELSVGAEGTFVNTNNQFNVSLVQAGSVSLSYTAMANPWAANSANLITARVSARMQLAKNDTVTAKFMVAGAAKDSGAQGNTAGARYTAFTGIQTS
jgi:hypothetical protein